MLSFSEFKSRGDTPIYVQIVQYIKRGIVAGNILDGDDLPSRRVLSATLGINPNTVQKAYKLLEDEELIASRPGAGSVVVVSADVIERLREELVVRDVKEVLAAVKQMGISKERAVSLIYSLWENSENEKAYSEEGEE